MTTRTDLAIAAPLSTDRPRPSDRMASAEGWAEAGAPVAAADVPCLRAEERGRWLHGPVLDFLLLGGGSFLILGAMAAFWPRDDAARVALAGTMLLLAHFVNHPHFAHSYQIFYRGFARKAFGPDSPLATRYRFAGLLVPAVLVAFFAAALAKGSVALLGFAANVMVFTAGWHYAKQGFGILMLDAARSGLRFAPRARRRLLWNTHLAWVTYWLFANDLLKARELWGITYYFFDVPDPLLFAMAALVAVSTLVVTRDLFALCRAQGALPVNGLLAYVAAVYVWLAVGRLDPVLLLVVPFFHSLQYLAVVWRYQLNVEAAARRPTADSFFAPADPAALKSGNTPLPSGAFGVEEIPWKAWLRSAPIGLVRFILAGGALGFAGFWLAPITIDALSGYDQTVFGATLFLFIGWTFINIHHYFIDNMIWRRENVDTRRHLFEA